MSVDTEIWAAEPETDRVTRLDTAVTGMQQRLDELSHALAQQAELTRQETERADTNYRALSETKDEFEAFKRRVVEVGGQAAEEHDWCGTYDQIMAELGLPGREREYSIEIRCHYTTTVTTRACSQDAAEEVVGEMGMVERFRPPPFVRGTDSGLAHSLEFEII